MSPTFYVGELIREGRLQAVLTEYKAPETAVYAIYPEPLAEGAWVYRVFRAALWS